MGINITQTRVNVGNPHRVLGGFSFVHQLGTFQVGHQYSIKQRCITRRGFLCHSANFGAARNRNGARFALQFAQNKFEQGGFTRAVSPNEANFLAIW